MAVTPVPEYERIIQCNECLHFSTYYDIFTDTEDVTCDNGLPMMAHCPEYTGYDEENEFLFQQQMDKED